MTLQILDSLLPRDNPEKFYAVLLWSFGIEVTFISTFCSYNISNWQVRLVFAAVEICTSAK